ncbi:DNA-binding transcriptional activator of the SARP family [Paenibacillus sp. UNC496MF]|uniref:AfsR/SARP family transcriptional regulator n=1 Tax=Paenibacillus sp. UNC496MF TaxID=1502753 RepID=UPI0008DF337C|nr:BTAD domain-containing putative transcriptional regulator [Paenibacillus sp. UNC496MF]SFJ27427.1 DNA-binding transcriptional activator of the SARP family [Paenibacillus sp. UNC496MF]
MNQKNKRASQQDQWLGHVMKAEQTILDGQMLPIGQLLAIPADIRMKSPLLLRAECENGLLNGRLMETKQRLEAALRGFAAQADESAMLTMMAMLGLLHVQVGDRHESKPFLSLLAQEWARNPESCSGFVPWALARAAAGGAEPASRFDEARCLLFAAAERFREEGRALWAGFVLLDALLFDREARANPEWPFWINWLKRHTAEQPLAAAVARLLGSGTPDAGLCADMPVRYAYLGKAVLLNRAEEQLPEELADDIESGLYAASAAIRRLLAEGNAGAAAIALRSFDRQRRLLSTPELERLAGELRERLDAAIADPVPAGLTESGADRGLAPRQAPGRDEGGEAQSAAKWTIKLFDGIGFSAGNGPMAEPVWKRRKAGELFVYLLLQSGYKSNREHVVERVFGEGDAAKRSNQLYVTLHDLRSALKEIGFQDDAVYAKRGVVGIAEHAVEAVDVETFMTLSRVGDQLWMDDREAASRLYDKALPLYGMLATELPHAEWLDRTREQLLDRQTTMLKRLAAYYGEQGDEAREEQRVSDWIALRPNQEDAYEAMIRLCLRGGRRVEAIGWYRRLERICREELGTEPLEEVRQLLWS